MEHLPPWLRNLPLPPKPASLAAPAGGQEDVPDWLRELQSEVAAADAPAPPPAPPAAEPPARPQAFGATSWLASLGSGEDTPPPAEPAPEGADQPPSTTTNSRVKMPVGATDWLRSIGRDPDGKSEPISEPLTPAEESGVPEWLRDLSAEDVARAVEAEQPAPEPPPEPQPLSWLDDDTPADASTVSANWPARPAPDDTADAGVPDWLRDVFDADDDARPAPPAAARPDESESNLAAGVEVPAWLRDLGAPDEGPDDSPPARRPDEEPDWLRGQAEQPASSWEQPAAEEAPAWLREAEQPPPAPPARAASADDDDVPAWLREAEQPSAPPARAAGDDDDDVPAWLREAEQPPPAPPARAAADDDVPAWLREAEQQPPAPPARAAADDDDVPAWLREAEQPPPAGASGDVPTWLRDVEQPPDAAAASPAAEAASDEVPEWLREAERPPDPAAPTWLRDAIAEREGEPAMPPPAASDIPPWLIEDEPPPPPPRQPTAPPASDLPAWLTADEPGPGPSPAPASDPGLPSWLRGVSDEPPARARPEPPPPRRPAPAAEEGDSSSFLKGAELPSWLRVPEPELPTESVEGQQLDWLRRLGGPEQEDEVDVDMQAAAAALRPARPAYQRSPEQLEAMALLRSLTRAPYPEPAPAAPPAPKSRLERIGLDRLLYLILAVALVVGALAPQVAAPLQTTTPAAPGATELGAALAALGPEDVVLVAYEWGAQRSAELRPLEQAVLSRLAANKTKLILVSTDLQGTLLSFDLRESLRAAGYNVEPDGREFGGRDYVLLGYRPGGELALRSLAQDLRGELRSDFTGQDASQSLVANNTDGTPRIAGIQDLALILVLADQPQDVQVWMEQIRPATRDADGLVPMAFVLPHEAQPLAQPYLRLDGVYHVAGQQGALALLADAGADGPALAQATGQLWYSVLVFLILLLLGAIGGAAVRARGARARGGNA